MTMAEKIRVHVMIEREDAENRIAWTYWNSIPVSEIIEMINEKDRAMEWDDQFDFLCGSLESRK